MRQSVLLLLLVILLLPSTTARAGLVLEVSVGTHNPDTHTTIIEVLARKAADTDADVTVLSMNLPLDLGDDGHGTPDGFSFGAISSDYFSSTSLNLTTAPGLASAGITPNFDAIANFSGGTASVTSTSNVPLYSLEIQIGPEASLRVVPLAIVTAADPPGLFAYDAVDPADVLVPLEPTIAGTISAVPEPNSLLCMTLVLLGGLGWRLLPSKTRFLRYPG